MHIMHTMTDSSSCLKRLYEYFSPSLSFACCSSSTVTLPSLAAVRHCQQGQVALKHRPSFYYTRMFLGCLAWLVEKGFYIILFLAGFTAFICSLHSRCQFQRPFPLFAIVQGSAEYFKYIQTRVNTCEYYPRF